MEQKIELKPHEILREHLSKKGISQRFVATHLNLSDAWISRVLSGSLEFTPEQIEKVEILLEIKLRN